MTTDGSMDKGALGILITGGTENWSAERWRDRFAALCKDRKVAMLPDPAASDDIRYAAVWKPVPGALKALPNLKVIFNLGAGVDAVLADATLPDVPLVRVANDNLTGRMTEYVVMHVLMYHRQQRYYDASQRAKIWKPKLQWPASAMRVGVLGLGQIAMDSVEVLKRLGFRVAGWSRTPRRVDGVECFSGDAGFEPFLRRTDILVCLLPLTPQTQGILNRKTFSMLARDGMLGGPVVINAGRGGLQVEQDILACLDDSTLAGATLDVFATEPLPPDSPFWTHPKVTISPHNAADTDPDAISHDVIDQIEAFERGEPLRHVVERARGY
jgi:glyoxylate/hydroxypyruvate reductase A